MAPPDLPPLLAIETSCDDTAAAIQYQVRAADAAQTAEVSIDGRTAETVALPFEAEGSGASFSIRAAADGPLDVTVQVDGRVRERAQGRVVALTGDVDGGEVEVEGPLEAVADDALTVRGLTFRVTSETELEGDDRDLPLDALRIGDRIEVEGAYDADGALVASEVEVDEDDGEEEVEVEGRVESVDGDELVVAGLAFLVTADTEFDGADDLDDILVGDLVEIEGTFDADGALVALEVELDD